MAVLRLPMTAVGGKLNVDMSRGRGHARLLILINIKNRIDIALTPAAHTTITPNTVNMAPFVVMAPRTLRSGCSFMSVLVYGSVVPAIGSRRRVVDDARVLRGSRIHEPYFPLPVALHKLECLLHLSLHLLPL